MEMTIELTQILMGHDVVSLTAILSFLGLFAGRFLAQLSREEIEIGKKYFTILRIALAGLLILLGTAEFISPLGQFGAVVGGILLLSRRNLFILTYPTWGFLLGINATHEPALLAGCIFIYGLVEGALRFDKKVISYFDLTFFVALITGLLL